MCFGKRSKKAGWISFDESVPDGFRANLQRELIVAPHGGILINGRSNDGRSRNQSHVVAAQRSVDERLLRVVGRLQNIVAYEAERLAQIKTGFRKMIYQRGRKRTIFRVTVRRGRSRLG